MASVRLSNWAWCGSQNVPFPVGSRQCCLHSWLNLAKGRINSSFKALYYSIAVISLLLQGTSANFHFWEVSIRLEGGRDERLFTGSTEDLLLIIPSTCSLTRNLFLPKEEKIDQLIFIDFILTILQAVTRLTELRFSINANVGFRGRSGHFSRSTHRTSRRGSYSSAENASHYRSLGARRPPPRNLYF